ncbi:hypothetical protein Nepgr_006647 [Nepenthes gracilis]|uniref:Uncharacterized protein n=1 Tax=Nepenthes gracilis TaxID=150966 RepID=A0AAD3S5E9_NEPGR|nr:hypothetical protein Nepgr_006647 [Nepenthes gracilis]
MKSAAFPHTKSAYETSNLSSKPKPARESTSVNPSSRKPNRCPLQARSGKGKRQLATSATPHKQNGLSFRGNQETYTPADNKR